MARVKRISTDANPNPRLPPSKKAKTTQQAPTPEMEPPPAVRLCNLFSPDRERWRRYKPPEATASKHYPTDTTRNASQSVATKGKVPDYKNWVCLCGRLAYGAELEEEEDDSRGSENDNDQDVGRTNRIAKVHDGGATCLCFKSPQAHSDHVTVITKKGYDLFIKWTQELENRDQDIHGEYNGNDYNGYAAVEVVENIILAFNHEYSKKRLNIHSMWSQVERLALFTKQLRNHPEFNMLDDSVRVAKLVMLTGTVVLTAIYLLITKDQLDIQRTQLRNLILVLGFFLEFAVAMSNLCRDKEDGWKTTLVTICMERDIFGHGIRGDRLNSVRRRFQGLAERFHEEEEEVEVDVKADNAVAPEEEGASASNRWKAYEGETRSWKSWCFHEELSAYEERYGTEMGDYPFGESNLKIGGRRYDFTKKPGPNDRVISFRKE